MADARERDANTLALAEPVARAERTDVDGLQVRLATTERGREAARARAAGLEAEVAAIRSLPTLRLRDALLRVPVIGPLMQIGLRSRRKSPSQPHP